MARITCGEGIPDFYAKQVTKDAQCHGDWSLPEFYYVTNTFGACKKMSEYNYTLDEN